MFLGPTMPFSSVTIPVQLRPSYPAWNSLHLPLPLVVPALCFWNELRLSQTSCILGYRPSVDVRCHFRVVQAYLRMGGLNFILYRGLYI